LIKFIDVNAHGKSTIIFSMPCATGAIVYKE
jgi:hypothetical protein